jgi:hypothetical protein
MYFVPKSFKKSQPQASLFELEDGMPPKSSERGGKTEEETSFS